MVRDLFNSVPEWLLAILFVGAVVLMTLGAFTLAQRYLSRWRSAGSIDSVVAVAAMVMTLYALVLAFVVVNLYNDYSGANVDVTDEANALGALVEDARALPPADRTRLDHAVARYIAEVRAHEFTKLADGSRDSNAQRLASDIFDAARASSPKSATEQTFYRAVVDQLNTFVGERENRVAKAGTSIPAPLLVLMIFLAILTIAASLLIRTHNRGLDVALIVTVSIVVASGLLTALILQYPYSGSIAVSSDPFIHGSLTELPTLSS